MSKRPSKREINQPRPINITRNYTEHAEGSVLIEFGKTRVLCNASVVDGVPKFIKGKGQGCAEGRSEGCAEGRQREQKFQVSS